MKLQFGSINLFSLQDWQDYNLYLIVLLSMALIYVGYTLVVASISNSKNQQPRYILPLEFNYPSNLVTKVTIEQTRDLFSQIHALSRSNHTNEVIGLNLSHSKGGLIIFITCTSKTVLTSISEVISGNKSLNISTGTINQTSEHSNIQTPSNKLFLGQINLQERNFPIRTDSISFSADLFTTILNQADFCGLSITVVPYDYQTKFHLKASHLEREKQNNKGVRYLPEQNKSRAKLLRQKNQHPLFLTKIEVIGSSREQVKQITSKFNALSNDRNQFKSSGITEARGREFRHWITLEYWFSYLVPKTNFYLNSEELAYIFQPIKTVKGDVDGTVVGKKGEEKFKIDH